jgi:hypothetical protein|eukprot:COSAG01_NODE_2865_length_6950_cov_5.005401_7_plen_71_part_00
MVYPSFGTGTFPTHALFLATNTERRGDPGPEALRRKVAASVYRDDRTMQAALQHFADFWGGAAGLRIRKR